MYCGHLRKILATVDGEVTGAVECGLGGECLCDKCGGIDADTGVAMGEP